MPNRVTHRPDDLENNWIIIKAVWIILHRIDDLEKYQQMPLQ